MLRIFDSGQSIETDDFIEIIEGAGYTTNDTTSKLRQDLKVGSMLKEGTAFDDGNILMNFIR